MRPSQEMPRLAVLLSLPLLAAQLRCGAASPPEKVPWTQEDLLRFAPEVRVHPNDRYLPSAVEPYLDAVELVNARTGAVAAERLSPAQLGSLLGEPPDAYHLRVRPPEGDPNGWLNAVYRGEAPVVEEGEERIQSPMYAHVLADPDGAHFDFQYVFFYPFSGPQVFRIGLAEDSCFLGICVCSGTSKWTGYWPPFATHEGDFEHVTVRVTADFSEVVAVYMDAHGTEKGRWWRADDPTLQFAEGTHVAVYSALHTHASYPRPDEGITLEEAPPEALAAAGPFTCGPVTCGYFGAVHWLNFADATRDGGPVWRPWRGTPLVELRFGPGGTPANGQAWLGFPGRYGARWGPEVFDVGFPRLACNDLAGCPNLKDCAGEALVAAFDIGQWLGKIKDDTLNRAGPPLASASWFAHGDPPLPAAPSP